MCGKNKAADLVPKENSSGPLSPAVLGGGLGGLVEPERTKRETELELLPWFYSCNDKPRILRLL